MSFMNVFIFVKLRRPPPDKHVVNVDYWNKPKDRFWVNAGFKGYGYGCLVSVDDNHFVLIGGSFPRNVTLWHKKQGYIKNLPDTIQYRLRFHACAKYINDEAKEVLLVTGNVADGNGITELMVDRIKWETIGAPLPHPGSSEFRNFMHAVTLDNKVYVAGGLA